jgi:RNase adaptor protein for sRNA GlmZ degradation
MTVTFAVKTLTELALILLLSYGFYRERDVIRFEKKVGRFIRFMINSYRQDFARKKLTVHKGVSGADERRINVA